MTTMRDYQTETQARITESLRAFVGQRWPYEPEQTGTVKTYCDMAIDEIARLQKKADALEQRIVHALSVLEDFRDYFDKYADLEAATDSGPNDMNREGQMLAQTEDLIKRLERGA